MKLHENPFIFAKPIWTEQTNEPNQYAAFRMTFVLDHAVCTPQLVIRADNRYVVWLNGEMLDTQQYSDYDFYRVYDRIDLSSALFHLGKNTIAVLGYCQNEDSSSYRKGTPSVIFELTDGTQVLVSSGETTLCSKSTGFTNGVLEKFSPQLSYSFCYDASADGWQMPDYQPEFGWEKAVCLPDSGRYYPRPIPQLAVGRPVAAHIFAQGVHLYDQTKRIGERLDSAWLKHVPFAQIAQGKKDLPDTSGTVFCRSEGDGIYVVIDLLKEQAGYFTLDIETKEAAKIDVGYGEHLDDLRVRTSVGGRNFAFQCHIVSGRTKFCYPIKRIGCRYLQLLIGAHEFVLHYAGVRSVDYPVSKKPLPPGLNAHRRRIYELSAATLQRCMHEHYEDTPWREQALYAMDSRNQMLCGYDAFEPTALPAASLRLLGLGLREDGLLELCAPARVDCTIPSFSLVWITELAEYYSHTGDISLLQEMCPIMERVLVFFYEWERDGLLYNPQGYWGFYEWSEFLDGLNQTRDKQVTRDGYDAPLNAFYVMALSAAAEIYSVLGNSEKSQEILKRISGLRERYRLMFYDDIKKAYRVSSTKECTEVFPQLVQALTICAGLCENHQERLLLARRLLSNEFQPEATLSHSLYLYQAMLDYPELHEKILGHIDEHWGNMVFAGATTFWETALGAADFDDAGSLCHGWSACPIYVYHRIFNDEPANDPQSTPGF